MHLPETLAARQRATSVAAVARAPADLVSFASIVLLSVALILLSGAEWMHAT
ncbi:hypothetical protein U91I_00407 [alpha proteobacterium U9-1i]|nr:hypothetical protein U91I_00407 [alpha proteobacterium U9-1i]